MNKTPNTPNTSFIPAMVALAKQADQQAQTAWLHDYRQARIAELQRAEFPHAKIEHFKYNRLDDAFAARNFERLAPVGTDALDLATRALDDLCADETVERVVFVNGIFSHELSHVNAHRVTQFAEANSAQQAKILAQFEAQSIAHNPFTQVNASLSDRGILIEIDENSPKAMIEILHIIDANAVDATLATQVVVDVAANSKATVISRSLNWALDSEHVNLSTQRTLFSIGENAYLTHYGLQLENASSLCFASSEYQLHSHATLKAFYGATGSLLKKLDITVNHVGEHAHAFLNGLYVATDAQQIDYHTTINHPKPNGQTDEVFRGIVNGQAEATFNGRIHIYEDAQKTRAELSNKNLILSDDAQIHTKPELEIYADDVVCAHGATVSRMNDESLNYLRARAIPKDEAELMLSYGFFNEVLADMEHECVADYLRPILFKRFEGA